jgi:uncharacterized protein
LNPFFFGSSAEPLFGVYHAPDSTSVRSAGVVLCYPMGQEYMRAHRAFRQLAFLLSRAGFHVMRFDYYGTGDSSGDGEEATAERWIDDIAAALDELKDTADVDELAVVGLRMGALLSAFATAERKDVTRLVLWDPIVSGAEYLNEVLSDHTGESFASNGNGATSGAAQTLGIMGFPMSATLRSGIERLRLTDTAPRSGTEYMVVVSDVNEDQRTLLSTLEGGGGEVTFRRVPSEGNWNEVDNFGSALIPQAIIREIVNYLSEKVRS